MIFLLYLDKAEEVDKWALEDKMFVETRASTQLLKRLRKRHIKTITVVGSFGVGKTCTTRHMALLLRLEGYRILPVSTPAEIKDLDDEDFPTVFIVDDFCGRGYLKQRARDIKLWRKMSEDSVGSNSKIIVCCMSMIYQHSAFKCLTFFRTCVIDLNLSGLSLDYSELRSIAKMHADIDGNLIKKHSKKYSFFPFLCKLCQMLSEQEKEIPQAVCHEAILNNANIVYRSQIDFFHREDNAKYTALAMVIQLNNYVKEGYFKTTSKDYIPVSNKINRTLQACEFDNKNALSEIMEELKSMIGSYIIVSVDSRNEIVYSAKNVDVYEDLVSYFKKKLPDYFIGAFPSHKNYSKFHSVLTYVHNRVNILTPILFSWLMFVIGIWVVLYSVFTEIKAAKHKWFDGIHEN